MSPGSARPCSSLGTASCSAAVSLWWRGGGLWGPLLHRGGGAAQTKGQSVLVSQLARASQGPAPGMRLPTQSGCCGGVPHPLATWPRRAQQKGALGKPDSLPPGSWSREAQEWAATWNVHAAEGPLGCSSLGGWVTCELSRRGTGGK